VPVPTTTTEAPTTTAEAPATSTTAEPTTTVPTYLAPEELRIEAFPVPAGSRPHDVAPALDGGVWYTAQSIGELGWLDPETGETNHVPLGSGSRPHGVIVDDMGTAWITDGGLNAIVSFDPATGDVTVYPLPDARPDANLNTAAFDGRGTLWFTGQEGIYGSLVPETGAMEVYDAPEGEGPYGIAATPDGDVFYVSLAGSYLGAIEPDGSVSVIEPTTPGSGTRRVWSDSSGALWVSEWNSGSLSRYTPDTGQWMTWPLPGEEPAAYAVYVDEADIVWVSDFGANAMMRFDPAAEAFTTHGLPHDPGDVRQILGRPGEIWGAESAADHLILIRTR
jgi:virginiamycin B lyase